MDIQAHITIHLMHGKTGKKAFYKGNYYNELYLLIVASSLRIKGKIGGALFGASEDANLLFTRDWTRQLNCNVAVRGCPVLCLMSLPLSKTKPLPICTLGSREAS